MKKVLLLGLILAKCCYAQSTPLPARDQTSKDIKINNLPNTPNELKTMAAQVVEQIKKYSETGTRPWDYQTAVKDLPVQVGSLTKLIMQRQGERFAHGMGREELTVKIADELSDILSLVLFIAHELEIDLNEAWNNMLKSDAVKLAQRNQPGK